MTETSSEELVRQFRDYLEKAHEDQKALPRKLDLFSFYSEITALKNEVKIESRLIKQGLDNFKETAGLIEQGNSRLDSLLQESGTEQRNAGTSALRPVLKGLLDLHDRIQASLQTIPKSRLSGPSFWQRLCRRNDGKILHSMRVGQEMTLERIIELLSDCGVSPIEVSDHRFDPHTMRAVETDSLPELADGMVSEELRTGFTWNGEVLRLADVRVNRRQVTDISKNIFRSIFKNIFKSRQVPLNLK